MTPRGSASLSSVPLRRLARVATLVALAVPALLAAPAAAQAPVRIDRFPSARISSPRPVDRLRAAPPSAPAPSPDTRVASTVGLTCVGTAVSVGALALTALGHALDGPGPYPGLLVVSALTPGVSGYLGSGARASLPLTLLASAAPVLVLEAAGGVDGDTPGPLVLAVPVAQLVGTTLVALHTARPVTDP